MTTPETLFTAVAGAIVGDVKLVRLNAVDFRGQRILNTSVPAEHHGKLIGHGGSTIDALRLILVLAARRNGVQCSLRVKAPEQRYEGELAPFTPNLNWNSDWLLKLVTGLAEQCFVKPVVVEVTNRNDGSTHIQFVLASNEPSPVPDGQIQNAMVALFKVIGLTNGRKLRFEMRRA